MDDPIRVLIVDDHALFLDGLEMLLSAEEGIDIAGVAKTGEECLRQCEALRPDVVLLDIDLPDIDGIEVANRMKESGSDARIVIVSAYQEPESIVRAVDAGAIGYVPKTRAADDLIETIEAASLGEMRLPAKYVGPVLSRLQERGRGEDEAREIASQLTRRELEVLQALMGGESPSAIAKHLGVSLFTVRGHIRGVLSKLGVRSIAEAVALAYRQGLTQADGGGESGLSR
jgi:NarL family two-component system response regulator LiaR